MQLKNTKPHNKQFFFYRKEKGKADVLDFVHIPGGATVEMDDKIFEAICASTTTVTVMQKVEVELDAANVGADIKNGKEKLIAIEYLPTGERKTVSLVKEQIRKGELVVIERVAATMEQIDKLLNSKGISVKDMSEDAKLALYDQLA
ncbi:hypothetical protein HOT32_gp54 [Erwinia phage Faunus]|uniref:Uncharacterized protein n=1 Tax=Erwinia phage Faunus TaxID=2182346 RepID=A0A2U8UWY9_9CAUD|nr:hypothetical protein HOT32_gp54 [Erwinia phage Faunus]AWN08637.1 hypothetical protein [Erwinia phage Faunus]